MIPLSDGYTARRLAQHLDTIGVTWQDNGGRWRKPSSRWVISQAIEAGLSWFTPNRPQIMPGGQGRQLLIAGDLFDAARDLAAKHPGWSASSILRTALRDGLAEIERLSKDVMPADPARAAVNNPFVE